ncbi:MAG: hypothetical protein GOU97_01710 [Nanoarchaeota archaeon]|nr:hypothetical protein [Nanoarchaeota archaeon]
MWIFDDKVYFVKAAGFEQGNNMITMTLEHLSEKNAKKKALVWHKLVKAQQKIEPKIRKLLAVGKFKEAEKLQKDANIQKLLKDYKKIRGARVILTTRMIFNVGQIITEDQLELLAQGA